jgi:hypothetical protein
LEIVGGDLDLDVPEDQGADVPPAWDVYRPWRIVTISDHTGQDRQECEQQEPALYSQVGDGRQHGALDDQAITKALLGCQQVASQAIKGVPDVLEEIAGQL